MSHEKPAPPDSKLFDLESRIKKDPSECSQCHSPMVLRPLAPYPVLVQILFGVSFIAFILTYEKFYKQPSILWVWSLVQIILGAMLVRGRIHAKKRVYRCVRCSADLR